MGEKLLLPRAILKRSLLAMAALVLLVVMGTSLIGTPAASALANTPAVGAPTINGTVQASETLTADTSGITDGNGLVNVIFYCRWISSAGTTDTDISYETNPTYVEWLLPTMSDTRRAASES